MGIEIEIGWLTLIMFGSLLALLMAGLPLAFVTGGLACVFLFILGDQILIKEQPFELASVLNHRMLVVAILCAVITTVFAFFAYLGNLRSDKEIE